MLQLEPGIAAAAEILFVEPEEVVAELGKPRPVAVVSNVMIEYRPAPAKPVRKSRD